MITDNIHRIKEELPPEVNLVAVSKYYPAEAVMEAYEAGQRCFAESRPLDFAAKVEVDKFVAEKAVIIAAVATVAAI